MVLLSETFAQEMNRLKQKEKKLRDEIDELIAKDHAEVQMIELTWFEERGILPLLLLGILFLTVCAATWYRHVLLTVTSGALACALFNATLRIRFNAQKKHAHNLPIVKRRREIVNLIFDLDEIERQKVSLPSDILDKHANRHHESAG